MLHPICPACHADAREGATFTLHEMTLQEGVARGFDPERTSAAWFRCLACEHEFPAFRLVDGRLEENLVRDDGTPFTSKLDPWWQGPIKVVCDETNNTPESVARGELFVDLIPSGGRDGR